MTDEEIHERLDERVRRHGFTIQMVESSDSAPSWMYTIGLIDRYDHPELLLVTCDPTAGAAIINELVGAIERGERFDTVTIATTDVVQVPIVSVNDAQLRDGVLAVWHEYYSRLGRGELRLSARQLIVDDLCCRAHRQRRWRLNQPFPLLNSHNARSTSGRGPSAERRRKNERRRQQAARRVQQRRGRH